ncbi:hypothetical protein [Staphylococcus haemolyticus]|uniref:hypothetical protein n=1 Tax=Staphylococcus haemolyticus TaxID=1283 RepID=UPI003D9563A2
MAKKRLSVFVDSDTEKIMNVIKDEIDEGKLGFIQNQSHFFEMLILNFAYQILTDTQTFLKEPKELKKRLKAIELSKFTFADVQSELGNKQLQVVKEYQELLQEKKDLDEELDDKTDEITKLMSKIESLEEREEYLKKRINQTSMNMPAQNTNSGNVKQTVDTNTDKKKTNDRKEHKHKAHYPKAHIIQLVNYDEVLPEINIEMLEKYLKENRSDNFINSLNYTNKDDNALMTITPRVLREIENMITEFNKDIQLVETIQNYQEEMKQSETSRDGFVVMTLHIKEDERMKRLRQRREEKEQQKAKDEQERLERQAKHDKKIKAKEQNIPEEVIEKEEQKQQNYDEQQEDTESANIIVEEGLYRLNIEVTVKNKYNEDEKLELKDDNMELEESDLNDEFIKNIIEITGDFMERNENFDKTIKVEDFDENDIQYNRNQIIKSWRNNEVAKLDWGNESWQTT